MSLAKLRHSPMFSLRILWVIFNLPFVFPGFAQTAFTQIDTVKIYFDSDKSEVKQDFIDAIVTMKDRYAQDTITSILLQGHTDSRASDLYNMDLSKRRVDAAEEVLIPLGLQSLIVKKDYMGENLPIANNATKEGRQQNRRVDVIFTVSPTIAPPVPEPIPEDTCTYDTTFYRDGVKLTMNICDFTREKECLEVVRYISPQELYEAGLNTVTSTGQPLISGGMLSVKKCTDACISVQMPVPRNPCAEGDGMSLWTITPNGGWRELDEDIEYNKENDTVYYSIQVCESAMINCDKLILEPPTYKVVAKSGMKLLSATISFEAPLYSMTDSQDEPFKTAKIPAPCPCKTAYLTAVAIDKQGDTLSMVLEPINQFKHRKWFKGCKVKERSKFLFFKFHDKSLYRKYILKPKDFESSTPRWKGL